MNEFTIAKYLRISSEDSDVNQADKLESNSIANQRNLLDSFIAHTPDFSGAAVTEFCDDGWSGKNFERPAFQEMIAQVQQGQIQCILVKDMSRFGRDYLVVGNYISRVFPFLGVRFIAVNDGIDSIRNEDIDSLDTSFKAILYDLYSRDLSRKVRNAQRFRSQRGDYISGLTPYGYIKDPASKKHLVPDPAAAEIVRRIFQMIGDGSTAIQVAKMLNDESVLTPMRHKEAAGFSSKGRNYIHKDNFWTDSMIVRIVRDESYLGKIVFGKRTRHTVGDWHSVKASRSDWIVVDNVHESIVSQEEFNRAQAALRTFAEHNVTNAKISILSGKMRCGVCGHGMIRAKKRQPYYYCRTPRVTSWYDCPKESVMEQDILDVLLDELHEQAATAIEMGRVWEERHKKENTDNSTIQKSIIRLKEMLGQQERQIKVLYESLVMGEISKEKYLAAKSAATKQRENTTAEIARQEAILNNTNNKGDMQNRFVSGFQKYREVEEITAEIIAEVLQEVRVYPDYRLEIRWNYQEDLERLLLEISDD